MHVGCLEAGAWKVPGRRVSLGQSKALTTHAVHCHYGAPEGGTRALRGSAVPICAALNGITVQHTHTLTSKCS
eukprot:571031-Prymnesium_polylepis.1